MFVVKLELTYILKIDCQVFKCTTRSSQKVLRAMLERGKAVPDF